MSVVGEYTGQTLYVIEIPLNIFILPFEYTFEVMSDGYLNKSQRLKIVMCERVVPMGTPPSSMATLVPSTPLILTSRCAGRGKFEIGVRIPGTISMRMLVQLSECCIGKFCGSRRTAGTQKRPLMMICSQWRSC